MTDALLGMCDEIDESIIDGVTDATSTHTTLTTVTVASLLPPSTKNLWENDARLLCDPSWSYESGNLICNSVNASIYVRVRAGTTLGIIFPSTLYGTTGRDSQPIICRPGVMRYRQFTTPDTRDAATWADFIPQVGSAGGFVCVPSADDITIEFQTKSRCDIMGCTAGADSMALATEGGMEPFLGWVISGFTTNAETKFESIEWPQLPFEHALFSDSNDDDSVQYATGDTPITRNEPRGSLLTGVDHTDTATWNKAGTPVMYGPRVMSYILGRLNRRGVSVWNAHGGAWQAGEMATDFRNVWESGTPPTWAYLYGNPSTRIFKRRNADTSWTSASDRVTLGEFLPKLFAIRSFINDALRSKLAAELGKTDTFNGSDIKDAVGKRAGSVGIIQKILDQFPNAKIWATLGPILDASASTATWTSTVAANVWAALTGTDAAYFRFGQGQADALTGLALRLSDYVATTGLPNDLSRTHFTAAEHGLVFDAISGIVEAWLHTALGMIFVDQVNGLDANAGTMDAPKKTIAAANNLGTILCLKRGSTFTELATFAGYSTVCSYGTSGANPIIYGQGVRNCATLTARSALTIHGIDFAGGIIGLSLATSANTVKVYDCNFYLNTSHGISANCTGSGNVFERCAIYSNSGDGISAASSFAFTSRRCNIYTNTLNGVTLGGTSSMTDERSYIRDNQTTSTGGDVYVNGGTLTARNSVFATKIIPVSLNASVYMASGTTTLQNCTLYNTGDQVGVYCLRADAGLLTWKNCLFAGNNNINAVYVRVQSTGASGQIVAATNNVYDNYDGAGVTDIKFIVNSPLSINTFDEWRLLTNRGGAAIESGSSYAFTNLVVESSDTTVLDDVFNVEPQATSAARSAGTNLTGTFSNDFRQATRAASGAWTAGAFE